MLSYMEQNQRNQPTTDAALPSHLKFLNEHDLVTMGVAGSVHTVRTWRRLRKGPRFVKIGTSVKYRLSDVEQFLNSLPSGGGVVAA